MSDQSVTIELNPEERRLYERLRSRVVTAKPRGASSGLLDLVFLLPDLTVLLVRLLRDERVPLFSKAVAVGGVAYVLSPIDVLPSLFLGPVGLIDDLIVVSACLSGMLNRVHPDVVRAHWSGQGDALEAIASVTELVEGRFVGGLRSAFDRVRGKRARD
jgi:uncharacterized membrane protein YkvA (DUF1232 family)